MPKGYGALTIRKKYFINSHHKNKNYNANRISNLVILTNSVLTLKSTVYKITISVTWTLTTEHVTQTSEAYEHRCSKLYITQYERWSGMKEEMSFILFSSCEE